MEVDTAQKKSKKSKKIKKEVVVEEAEEEVAAVEEDTNGHELKHEVQQILDEGVTEEDEANLTVGLSESSHIKAKLIFFDLKF